MCCQLDVRRYKARPPEELCPADLLKCIEGRKQLLKAHASAICEILCPPLPGRWFEDCQAHGGSCIYALNALAQDVADTQRYPEHALWDWEDGIVNAGLCTPCRERLVKRARQRACVAWLDLPRCLSLDDIEWKRLVTPEVDAFLRLQ